MFLSARNKIWYLTTSKMSEGAMLPWWVLTVRAILFPLDFFYWHMNKTHGYNWQNDTWRIEGVNYTGAAIRLLSNANGETYKIKRTGETVTMFRVNDSNVDKLRAELKEIRERINAIGTDGQKFRGEHWNE